MSNTITVYSAPNCRGCRFTKRTLDVAGITYTEVEDAAEHIDLVEEIKERARIQGVQAKWPYVSVFNEQNELVADWVDYRPDLIEEHITGRAA